MSDQPTQPMEEILASIRKIIADDRPITPPAPLAAAPDDDEDDVLELGEAVAESASPIFPPPPVTAAVSVAPLVSGIAAEASRKAFSALAGVKLDPEAAPDTLDGLVREMLRSMLKEWLDAHLPDLVERVVAREIARLGTR